nr:MAG TPA: hypothetical protein [Caudoviricetes sp.]
MLCITVSSRSSVFCSLFVSILFISFLFNANRVFVTVVCEFVTIIRHVVTGVKRILCFCCEKH